MKTILMVLVAIIITSTVYAFTLEIKWSANPSTDNVKEYKIYRCMSSMNKTCQPRPGKDPRYTNMTSISFINSTTVTTKLKGLTGIHNIYVTATNGVQESGSSNVVSENGIKGNVGIRIVKE
jgi:hypothetical protein